MMINFAAVCVNVFSFFRFELIITNNTLLSLHYYYNNNFKILLKIAKIKICFMNNFTYTQIKP
jgi:hypothetical protein